MQGKQNLQDVLNIFIEFQIIRESDTESLTKELDMMIAAGKRIHIWSKTVPPVEMAKYCYSVKINPPAKEKELHEKIWHLRHKERKTFADIATLLDIPTKRISYFVKVPPTRGWRLSDWIVSYEKKDSSIYPKVDFLVDNDEKLVARFKRVGRKANLISKV